jgi:hypothetical protein
MSVHIYGIRHHGPGSARSLRAALESLQPDIVLVEGPPDAQEVLPLLMHEQMRPPVALLVYAPEQTQRAVYYPFATFSPEWQAIRYALSRQIPVRFMDLPQYHRMAQEPLEPATSPDAETPAATEATGQEAPTESETAIAAEMPTAMLAAMPAEASLPAGEDQNRQDAAETQSQTQAQAALLDIRRDPLRWVALAAGCEDGETWWEQMVEHRRDGEDLFQGVLEMMAALREAAEAEAAINSNDAPLVSQDDRIEEQREAWMRQTIRTAQREGYARIAVVCGAWHAPALTELPSAAESGKGRPETRIREQAASDAATLRGLPKMKTVATWTPWTDERLTLRSGYGAGINSPAWYQHLWDDPHQVVTRWMTRAAALLRAEDLPASPASVIEAVRLAETLACVRGLPLPGLPELWEAAQAIFCFGSELPMRLIGEKLVVGDRLGHVPDETPMLPIQQDLRQEQKRLRLAPTAAHVDIDLDQRKPNDLDKSRLLHRLNLLGVPWGAPQGEPWGGKTKSTFHERWRLQWQPEFEVRLIEANVWGVTIASAAAGRVREQIGALDALPALTALVERVLLADLPDCIEQLMTRLRNLAAITSDVPHLMEALPPLVQVLRYGNVRQTDTGMVSHVVDGLLARICIGLPAACSALNDEAAEQMYPRLLSVDESVGMLQRDDHRAAWQATLLRLADQNGLHGLIAGRCCRLLLDRQTLLAEEAGVRMNLALSTASDPALAAAWVDGLLRGSGALLLHDDALWSILDAWVADLKSEEFTQLLPLLRRTFSTFAAPERRQLGQRARTAGGRPTTQQSVERDFDLERAARVLPLASRLLGLKIDRD